jgi:hypothetical protein
MTESIVIRAISVNLLVDTLIPQVIWRGSDCTLLPTSHAFIPPPPKQMMGFVDDIGYEKKTQKAILMHLFHRWDDLSPRWKAFSK